MTAESHLERARALLASQDPRDVPYAALELRMAMEAITYDKLRAYAPRLPAALLDTWQPPQAMRALLQFEPRAASNSRIRFAKQLDEDGGLGPWQELGEHRSFSMAWLRKAYNAMGSVVHLPTPRSATKYPTELARREASRSTVEMLIPELERVASSQVLSTLAVLREFPCQMCGATVLINEAGARETGRAVCLVEKCSAEHLLTFDDPDIADIVLDATAFECLDCNHPTVVLHRDLKVNHEFRCAGCGTEHRFVSKSWGYARKADADARDMTDSHAGA